MFSRKTRKGLLGGVALALAGMMAGEAGAAGAVLINNTVCDDTLMSVQTKWANIEHDATDIYFMKPDGAIYPVNTEIDVKDQRRFYVMSHGNSSSIGSMSNSDFADAFFASQTKAPDEMLFSTCSAADAPEDKPSLLRYVQNKFVNTDGWPEDVQGIGSLHGAPGACKLVPATNYRYVGATFRVGPGVKSGINVPVTERMINNVNTLWVQEDSYKKGESFAEGCNRIAGGDTDFSEFAEFLAKAGNTFGEENVPPSEDVHNSLTILSIFEGGDPQDTCGRDTPCPTRE